MLHNMAFITIKMYNIIMINSYKYGGKFYGINKKISVNNERGSHTIHATSTLILHKRLSRLIHTSDHD